MSIVDGRAVALLAAAGAVGCGQYYEIGQPDAHRGFAMISTHGIVVTGPPPPRAEPVFVRTILIVDGAGPGAAPPARREAPRDERAFFDPIAARRALDDAADLSACRTAGAPSRYGHARVTLNPDGRVSKVVIDAPAGLPPETTACIGERLGKTRVAPFRGGLVTVGTSFFVGAAGVGEP